MLALVLAASEREGEAPLSALLSHADKQGNTALHVAAGHGQAAAVRTLLQKGASVQAAKEVTLRLEASLPCHARLHHLCDALS